MQAKILVTMNQAEINEALNTNKQNVQQRAYQNGQENPIEILDVEVPEKDVKEQPIVLNAFDVDFMTMGDAGMIYIRLLDGKAEFNLVYDESVWDTIANAIELKQKRQKQLN
jgi:3'-phosphoadenosine 5'-phosphosulfate (PAPS) 3'-phosphatase